jgi:UDP-N-acetyl-D-mannosaminuronic acid dehydrogenase
MIDLDRRQSHVKVTVLGLGYIGLPTAAMLALAGHRVSGYDISPRVRAGLGAGADWVQETEVRTLVRDALASGRLLIDDNLEPADAYIICVPTPNAPDGRPDLTYVQDATAAIVPHLKKNDLVILESTVPPGTTDRVVGGALRAGGVALDDVRIAHCPERVIPGAIASELAANSRIIGGRRAGDAAAARRLYESFVKGEICETDCTTAELVKVIENTFRDVNIALANELAIFCEELSVDAWEAIALANKHPRVNILNPGPGVGGHCIPIDPNFLADANPFMTELIQTARRVNARMPNHVARRIRDLVGAPADEKKIALLGASYKANVDDSRESPTEKIEHFLRDAGYATSVYDPIATRFARPLAPTLDEALQDADCLVLLVDHDVFKTIDPTRAAQAMRGRILVDARNFVSRQDWRDAGFTVYSLGRPQHSEEPTRSEPAGARLR